MGESAFAVEVWAFAEIPYSIKLLSTMLKLYGSPSQSLLLVCNINSAGTHLILTLIKVHNGALGFLTCHPIWLLKISTLND